MIELDIFSPVLHKGVVISDYLGAEELDISCFGFRYAEALKVIDICKDNWIIILGCDTYKVKEGSIEFVYNKYSMIVSENDPMMDVFKKSIIGYNVL